MKSKIVIGCDITKDKDDDCTVICVIERKRDTVTMLERIILEPDDPTYDSRLYDFHLKWHPNVCRRWLFRLLGI